MAKLIKSKTWTTALIMLIVLMMGGCVVLGVRFFEKFEDTANTSMFLNGEYSVDGGEWKKIDPEKEINDHFSKIVFRGTLKHETYLYHVITLSTRNVWFSLYKADGTEIAMHKYLSVDDSYKKFVDMGGGELLGEQYLDRDYFEKEFLASSAMAVNMPNTPGYCVLEYDTNFYRDEGDEQDEYIFEVEYPYDFPKASFSDCVSINLSEANGNYSQFFFHALPSILLFALVCFFGLFFFPIAGFIINKFDYKYLTFGALCFFWGLFMIVQSVSGYMNMWIGDPTVCLLFVSLSNYFFIASVLLYLKSNLQRGAAKIAGNIICTVYVLMIIAFVVLHFTNVIDIHASSIYMMAFTALCAVTLTVLQITEIRFNKAAVFLLISWIPLALSLIVDTLDHYMHFTKIDFYVFGLAITMAYQIVRLILDLRKQYKETIRYQKMQKELYEAKVSVMVSQIQPHFLYNSLSSIAMLCKVDPDTAYDATITFTQYLRSNMDSLKQTAPIPFTQELEHLKKYLYIEKLRFGKKLNIEYDIQATDFEIPQLSIQPLAENAVKHGISKKRGGGTLKIATKETEDSFEVIVSDDGTGFDVNEVKNDGRSHIGMENIKTRLKEMCNAEVVITSTIGEGTTAKIIIPKKNNEEN